MNARTRLIENAQIIDAESEDVQHQVDMDNAEEADIAAELGNADGDTVFVIKVHKHVPNSKDMLYCMEGTIADLPIIPKLQKAWGAGKYRIQILKNGKFYKRYHVSVAPLPVFGPEPSPQQTTQPANDPQVIALLQTLVQRTAEPPKPAFQLTPEGIATMIGAAATAITAIKSLLPPPVNQMETLKTVLEISQQFQGSAASDREPTFMETVARVLTNPEIVGTLGAVIAPQAQGAQPKQLAAPRPQQPTPEQATAAQVQAQLAYMCTRAQKGSDPGLYAELIIDSFDPALVAQMTAPGAIEYVLAMHPPAAQYRPWFEALLTSLAEQAIAEDDAPVGETPGGNDVTPNEGVSPVPAQSAPDAVIFDPIRHTGDADDAAIDGETSQGW